ncbi:vang-like protein [Plakobranchus ocellatus]|uniref:Vang-like protein n=1 Tax=Plakobranchus ocellatus TaxID=259542 RepID=A0AAV4CPD2_9GAST|nr:vang-like protein [Plakobranchus ocellatus]
MDGGESVRSGRSERSERSHRSHGSNHHAGGGHHRHNSHGRPQVPSRPGSHRNMQRNASYDTDRDDRSVTIKTPGQEMGIDRGEGEERIEVQVIPQDDNWGDNTTAITGNTSETGFSMEDLAKFAVKDNDRQVGVNCARYVGTTLTVGLSVLAFLSPIAMLLLPRLKLVEWRNDDGRNDSASECRPECEGLLISFAFKLLVLLVGAIALFFRKPRATMPRVFVFRAVVLFLVFVLTFAFWLFYGVRIFKEKQGTYEGIVKFALSLVDSLLFVHYVAIILLEIRQLQPQYAVRVVRSPDGESRIYNVGALSIQRAAVYILEHYYKDFEMYNPYLENVTKKHSKHSSTAFKVYDIDGSNQQAGGVGGGGMIGGGIGGPAGLRGSNHRAGSNNMFPQQRAGSGRGGGGGGGGHHNDRFYEEQEYERRVRKRRARLMVATEEAFTHIKRLHDEQGPAIAMDSQEAAAAVFPSLARALQKYLRVTRQQPRYTMDSVLAHLACCIAHDMSPRAFISRYLTQGPVICSGAAGGAGGMGGELEVRSTERWSLVCEQLLTRELDTSTIFQLKKGPVSLLCTVLKIPHFSLTEEMVHSKANKFVLRLNSETSV